VCSVEMCDLYRTPNEEGWDMYVELWNSKNIKKFWYVNLLVKR
jgi:hypothetical protein